MTNMMDVPLLAEYATYHRDARNRLCHEIGIPLIVLGIIVAERMVHFGPLDLALITIVGLAIYYVRLVGAGALGAIAGFFALYFLAAYLTWPFAIGTFVVGWIFQFIGHGYEGKSPAFLTNLLHLLVGPLWVAAMLQSRRTA